MQNTFRHRAVLGVTHQCDRQTDRRTERPSSIAPCDDAR